MRSLETKRFVYLALLCAVAIALSVFESIFIGPFMFGVIKIGLANIAALLALKLLGIKETVIVNLMRVVISSLLMGSFLGSSFWISLGGVCISTITLIITHKLNTSLIFTAILSAIAHSVGQVVIVAIFYMQARIALILPYLLLFSIPTGILTGVVATLVLKRIKPLKLKS